MKDLLKFIKSSGIYFVGTVLTKLISFLLLPLYTAYIDPEGYGIYDLYNSYIMFLGSVLFLDIWAGIMRFMYDYSGDERKKPIYCGTIIFLGSCILYTIILIFGVPLLNLQYPFWIFLCGILMNMQNLVGYIARGYGKNILYASAGVIGSVVTIIFNIILLVYFKMDFSALFIASCIGYIVNILVIVVGGKIPNLLSPGNYDRQLLKELFFFSLPLCLNSVAYWFLTGYNKVAVTYLLGSAENGYYAIAGRFGSMVTLFTSCFQMAWQELAYSKSAKENELGDFYSSAINNYIKCMGMGLIILIPAIYVIYPIMVNKSYDVGKSLVPLYLMGTILSTISSFLGNTFGAIKKNNLLFRTMLVGSIGNVVSVHLLLPIIGIQASNLALILGFLLTCGYRVYLLKKEIGLKVEFKLILFIAILFVCISIIYQRGSFWMNMLSFVAACLATLYIFRDILAAVLQKVRH